MSFLGKDILPTLLNKIKIVLEKFLVKIDYFYPRLNLMAISIKQLYLFFQNT